MLCNMRRCQLAEACAEDDSTRNPRCEHVQTVLQESHLLQDVRGSQERGGIGCKSPMVCFLSVKLKTPAAKMRGVRPGFASYQGSAKPRTFQLARWPLKPNAREPFSMRVKGSPKARRESETMNSGMDPYCRFYRSHALVHTLHAVRRGSPEPYQREMEWFEAFRMLCGLNGWYLEGQGDSVSILITSKGHITRTPLISTTNSHIKSP